ncbi:MAG TPA: hybrid sensor histidine kinase/response regulator [Polyangiales bacterium]|nr:hybrid sensor histidine kinase/response regulator [Polyangiales bacterium]
MAFRILATRSEILDALARAASTLPQAPTLTFERVPTSVQAAVAHEREKHPLALIGFAAEDESSALAAIAGGADDAMVFQLASNSELLAFLDRVELRGTLRAETQRLRDAFAHAEKLSELGGLIAGASHEINNPLSSVLLSLYVLRHKLVPAVEAATEVAELLEHGTPPSPQLAARLAGLRSGFDVPALLDDVNAAAQTIAGVVYDMRSFSRQDERAQLEVVNVPELIDRVLRLLARNISNQGIIERDYARDVPAILAPRTRLAQVITNLLSNALHAITEAPRPLHAIRIGVRRDEDFILIAISDTGPGIAPEMIERVFDPFYTTKRDAQGTGLGLTISRSIMRNLGGDLSVDSVYGEGATFLCFVPIRPVGVASTIQRPLAEPDPRDSTHSSVLVVDRDPQILRSYGRVLATTHRLLVARDEDEAIELLESGSEPDAIVAELGDPSLLAWLAEHRPTLVPRTVLVDSEGAPRQHAELLAQHPGPVLEKPLRGDSLLRALANLAQPD